MPTPWQYFSVSAPRVIRPPSLFGSLAAFVLMVCSAPAAAHGFHGAEGFLSGLVHPWLGADHFLAMVALGLWSAQRDGAAHWVMPTNFALAAAAGALLALFGVPPLWAPSVFEWAILASLVVLGLFLLLQVRLSVASSLVLTGLFGLVHGFAHGFEFSPGVGALAAVTGMTFATLLLSGAGVVLALQLRARTLTFPRSVGLGVLVFGLIGMVS